MTRQLSTQRRWLALPAVGLLVLTSSCGFFRDAGAQTTQQRTIDGVTAVRLLTSGDLSITVGETDSLTVTAGSNQLTGLTSQVIDGTLILDNKAATIADSHISYALTVPPLASLELSGSGNANGVGVLTGDAQVSATGSGEVSLSGLDLSSIVVDLSGSGNVQLAGTAASQHVTVSGSGEYAGSGLATQQTQVQVTGSGNAQVTVTGTLTATVSGSGNITYTGNPAQVDRNSSGSGDITAG
jgi:hypothetical protein